MSKSNTRQRHVARKIETSVWSHELTQGNKFRLRGVGTAFKSTLRDCTVQVQYTVQYKCLGQSCQ